MDSGTFRQDWLPGCRISRGLGHLWAGLVTRLGDLSWIRSPLDMIDYPTGRYSVDSVTFGRDWFPCLWISSEFGHLWAGLVTLLVDIPWIRSPFGRINYPIGGYPVDSVTFRQDWLPGWGISCGLGHHTAGLVTRLGHFEATRAPLGLISYPVGGYPVDSGTFGRD